MMQEPERDPLGKKNLGDFGYLIYLGSLGPEKQI